MPRLTAALVALALTASGHAFAIADPVFSPTGPDAAAYGEAQGYPSTMPTPLLPQRYMVGNYSRVARMTHANVVAKPPQPWPLRRAPEELSLTYRHQGTDRTIADYLAHSPATGLLIARDDTILLEHYQYGRTDRDRFLSQSMAKTITAALLGIAVAEGAIRSIDQPAADYVPGLVGSEYGGTPIRDLLHMASGIAFRETYDGADDIAALGRALFLPGGSDAARVVARFNTRQAPSGTRFHYASIETEVLGVVLTNAVHMTLAEYLQTRIWQPMGAEANAYWLTDSSGTQEAAYCCLNATLRDWARFALLLAHDGARDGRQIIPREWLLRSTTVAAPWLAPGVAARGNGYGNQVWLLPGPRRQFALLGIHGQTIFVDPAAQLVLVHTAVRLNATATGDPGAAELRALWLALVRRFAG